MTSRLRSVGISSRSQAGAGAGDPGATPRYEAREWWSFATPTAAAAWANGDRTEKDFCAPILAGEMDAPLFQVHLHALMSKVNRKGCVA
jgi:hypothetical protein